MLYKFLTLGIGVPLVALGSRLLCASFFPNSSLSVLVMAGVMLLIGQTVVRFEDLPNGNKRSIEINNWLHSKKELFLHKPSTLPTEINTAK